MIFKFALRNIVRLPWRSLLYGLIVFLLILSITASFFVFRACETAESALNENYIFVASLVKRTAGQGIPLSEVFKCLDSENIHAFNVTMAEGEGMLPVSGALTKLPNEDDKTEKPSVLLKQADCKLYAVENIALVYPFFSGECMMMQGEGFSKEGYHGERDEVVIPWWLAEMYDIKVGDRINRRYYKKTGEVAYIYIPTTVVGIYTTSEKTVKTEDYPAYIPLAVAETDYEKLYGNSRSVEDFTVERADFILETRESFATFVAFAKENELDFTSSDLIFNNSTYDVLTAELKNIRMIALFLLITVSLVGTAVLIFFTVYLCRSREKERMLLTALGMSKAKISLMIGTELTLIFILASVFGFFGGNGAANGICSFVNDSVLARASASEEIRNLHSASEFEITMPLEKNMHIEISAKGSSVSSLDTKINEIPILNENEIGISRHTFYVYMTGTESDQYFSYGSEATEEELKRLEMREKPTVSVVGVSDLSVFDLTAKRDVPKGVIALFVSESSPYADEESIFLSESNLGDYVSVHLLEAKISTSKVTSTRVYYIAGTYRDNAYCSGNDILVSMEDYHKTYAGCSITDEEDHFTRIADVYTKEES